MNSEDSRNRSDEYGTPSAKLARISRYDSPYSAVNPPKTGFRANVVTIHFRSTLAKIGEPKSPRALIDSGATHNFFYDKAIFTNYEPMANESVAAAFGTTHILVQGLVWIPLLGGMLVLAYHAPQFSFAYTRCLLSL